MRFLVWMSFCAAVVAAGFFVFTAIDKQRAVLAAKTAEAVQMEEKSSAKRFFIRVGRHCWMLISEFYLPKREQD